jgi:glucose-1-phosphate cytidylyltransferase
MTGLSQYQAVILCGGQGTRIRGVNDGLPKPLIDIGGKPILWHIMKIFSSFGIRRFILCLGHKGEAIIDYFENYHSHHQDFILHIKTGEKLFRDSDQHSDVDDWEISFALTGEDTMTGGRVKRIASCITEDRFFCTYGDGVANIDIKELFAFHLERKVIATLTGVHLPTTFGILEYNTHGIITSFREKPVMPGLINGGFFVFQREIFDYLEDDATVLEEKPFRRLVRNQQLAVFKNPGFWHCMDTYKDYQSLNKMWNENKAPWKIW